MRIAPEPFATKVGAFGCGVVAGVTGTLAATFGWFADTHEIGSEWQEAGLAHWLERLHGPKLLSRWNTTFYLGELVEH